MISLQDHLVSWLRTQAEKAGASGTVVGLSGGIDSAVAAALCHKAFGADALAVIIPIHSMAQDIDDARLVAKTLGLRTTEVCLDAVYDAFMASFPAGFEAGERQRLAAANVKARLRMVTLYYLANSLNYLVVGTGNRDELTVGYFTKYGDGGADVLLLGSLVKGQVRELARELGVPQPLIDKPPSAGLWPGQTDEGDMGLTYDQLDEYLLTGKAEPSVAAKIERMRLRSEHKRERPPIAPLPEGWG